MQFLIESVVIGVIGGLLGIACGVGIALAIAKVGDLHAIGRRGIQFFVDFGAMTVLYAGRP